MLTSNVYNTVRPYHSPNKQNPPSLIGGLTKSNPSFGLSSVMSASVKGLEWLEQRPVFAFVIMDSLGMVIPRSIIDLNRNKEELGHLNWNAGRETFLSEIWSDGMLFFVPGIGFTMIGNQMLNSKYNKLGINTTAFTDFKNLNMLETKLREIIQTSTEQKLDINTIRQKLARIVLENVFAASSENPHGIDPKLIDKVVNEVGSSMKRSNIDQLLVEDQNFQRLLESNPKIKSEIEATIKQLAQAPENAALSPETIRLKAIKSVTDQRFDDIRKFSGDLRKHLINSRDALHRDFITKIAPEIRTCLKEDEIVVAVENVSKQGINKAEGVAKDLLSKTKKVGNDIERLLRDIFYGTDDLVLKASKGASEMDREQFAQSFDDTVKHTKRFKALKVAVPLTIATLGLTLFPGFNMWLTRKLNGGKNEFPGVSGLIKNRDTDTSNMNGNSYDMSTNVSLKSNFNASNSDSFRKASIFDQIEGRI